MKFDLCFPILHITFILCSLLYVFSILFSKLSSALFLLLNKYHLNFLNLLSKYFPVNILLAKLVLVYQNFFWKDYFETFS